MPAHHRPYLRTTGHPHIPPESWRERALCLGHDLPPQTWDDTVGDYEIGDREHASMRAARVERAKSVCRRCPVIDDCLRDVDLKWDEGVRGGVDLRELRAALKQGGAS